jgi:hypothetical protein
MNSKLVGRWGVALATLTCVTSPAWAQDSNYWSSAYGTRSQLLGGVVTGSPGDISMVYYNPGALAIGQSSGFLLAGNAYQYASIGVDNGSGPGRKLSTSTLSAVPSLLAGELPILKHDKLAYAFLTRRSMNMSLERRTTEGIDAGVPIASPLFAAAELELSQNFTEGWYGFTWSHAFSPTLGFGVSPFVQVRSQHTLMGMLTEGQNASGQAAILNLSRDFDYIHWGALARMGLSGMRDSLTYGVTLTTPNVRVMGSGHTEYNTTLIDQTGTLGNVAGANYQEKLDAHFRTPLGLGAGASYGWDGTRIHGAIDWNAKVPEYTVIESPPFVVHKPSGDSTVVMSITDRLSEVFNWGLGIEHRFSTWSGYASYHTDLSGREKGDPPGHSVTRWNLSDVAAGAIFRIWRSDLALGLSAAFGSQPTNPPAQPIGGGTPVPADLKTHEMLVTVLLGWKLNF